MADKRKRPAKTYQLNPWAAAQVAAQRDLKPARIAPGVRSAVDAGFSETDHPAALAALRRYCGPETARVHRAVLALSGGKVDHLEAMVDAANEDYRDVLYWAEYPEAAAAGTPAQKGEAARRMAHKWRQMGLRVPFVVSTQEGTDG